MNNAELYEKNNSLQKKGTMQCLEEYSNKIKWKGKADKIIDIGCGDGSVTTKILKQYIPTNFEKLVGCDVSDNMVDHANKNHRDEKTSFILLDIGGTLPENMKNSFDHAFSFYAIHWVKDHQKVFSNIFDMLTEGGDCLLFFMGYIPMFHVYQILSRTEKWKSTLKNVEQFISPYHDSQDPETEIKELLNRIGYQNIMVTQRERCYTYESLEALKKAVQAVNPYKMSTGVFEDFMVDYLDVTRNMNLMHEVNNNDTTISSHYKIIIVYASKQTKEKP